MGEKTDRAIRSLKERLNGKGKPVAWTAGVLAALGAFGVGLDQGWVAVGFETTAHAASTYETREHAAETYETRAAADLAHLRLQTSINMIEHEHAEQMETIKLLQRDLTRLLVRLGVEPTEVGR